MNRLPALLLAVSTAAVVATGMLGTFAEERPAAADAAVKETAPVPAPVSRGQDCLTDADLREAVAEKRVVAPLTAIRAAREVLAPAEIQRAILCKRDQGLVYLLTALRRDGHFVQVLVDAKSGKVSEQW